MKALTKAVLAMLFILAVAMPAMAQQVPIEAFATFNKFGSPRLSPDGHHVALTMEMGDGNHAVVVIRLQDMQRTALLRLPPYELPVQMHWVSDKRLVIGKGRQFSSREAPIPLGEIIATDFDGTNQKYIYGYEQSSRIKGLDRGFGYIEGVPETRNGHFLMRRLSQGTRRSQLYDIDTNTTSSRLVADIPVKDLEFVLDRDGIARYAYGTDDDDRYLLYQADSQGKAWHPLDDAQLGGKFVPFAFSADGKRVFAYYSVSDGPYALVESDPDGGNRRQLAKDAFASVSDLEWTAAPSRPFAAAIGGGKPKMVYFEPESQDALLHEAISNSFPDQRATYVNHSSDGKTSLLYVYSDRNPGTWYLFERERRKVSKLLDSRANIDPARMGERRPFRFAASDGMELEGILTLPTGVREPERLPMVLLPHGGPHASGDTWSFDNDAQFLASRGYLVLQMNYRGTLGRGRAFEEAGYLKWGTRIQDDLLDGVRWAIGQGYADPNRICAYGASFGAYSAMMTAARAPELIKCAAGLSGLYDLGMMYRKGDIKDTRYGMNYLVRVVGRNDAELAANSPTSLAARIKAPVLLAHGESDERTPIAQAKAMKAALEQAGNAPEWMSVPREGHGFYKEENNIAFYQRLEAFLSKYIGAAPAAR